MINETFVVETQVSKREVANLLCSAFDPAVNGIGYWGRIVDQVEPNWTPGFLMIGTGIRDKRDEEIFEFDILKHPSFGLSVVILDPGGFTAKDHFIDSDKVGGSMWVNQEVNEESEVVGNVLQNPKLLQEILV